MAWRTQLRAGMAAVLCLVLIPLIASVGFMFGVVGGEMSGASIIGGIAFFLLAAFMLFGTFNLSRVWDEEESH